MTSTAYLLISHGSRDPRHQVAINRLAKLVRDQLNASQSWSTSLVAAMAEDDVRLSPTLWHGRTSHNGLKNNSGGGALLTADPVEKVATRKSSFQCPESIVGSAVLEFGLLPLHKQIVEFGRRLKSAGIRQLQLVPLFLLRGRHVMDDIPSEVDLARRQLGDSIEITFSDHIGGYESMPALVANRLSHSPAKGRLLVAHGSRRPKGNRPVDKLAKSLGTAVAYWTNEADIENQVIHLMQQGCSTLTIFPYFLFSGGITDAVAHMTEELAERFPRTRFRLLPPLGATADLANLVVGELEHGR